MFTFLTHNFNLSQKSMISLGKTQNKEKTRKKSGSKKYLFCKTTIVFFFF